jgi:hypothetical protein
MKIKNKEKQSSLDTNEEGDKRLENPLQSQYARFPSLRFKKKKKQQRK